MKQIVKFYLPEGAIFEATSYYCDLLQRAFVKNGNYSVVIISNLNDVNEQDYLVTIRINDPIELKIKPKRLIHWFQGIAPEERKMVGNYSFKSRLAAYKYSWMEKRILNKADITLFVSDSMRKHYQNKYKAKIKDKAVVIPCYNIKLEEEFLDTKAKRYEKPTFVYAGGIHNWQCIEETLLVFKEVHKKLNNATLTILTSHKQKAQELITKFEVPNVELNFVKLENLQVELSKYKYGFLLRKNNIVNNVATPTKMNSYLAAGLIPIYTSVVDDFELNIDLQDYSLKFNELDISNIAEAVCSFDNILIDANRLYRIYTNVFLKYYNDDVYIEAMNSKLLQLER